MRTARLTCAIAFILLLSLGSVAAAQQPALRLAYTDWSSSIASAYVVQGVIQEKLHRSCELVRLDVEEMWQALAEGRVDAMLSAWLPVTHADYWQTYSEQLVDLGPNLTGARIGLVVPDVSVGRQTGPLGERARPYIKAKSIEDLPKYAKEFRHRIIGIEPGAGIMARTREAMKAYGLEDFRLIDGSEVSMTAELSNAIRHQQWIVVTGWTPHWMFARWKLKFLEDPKNIFGGSESIHTLVRKGYAEDHPEIYALLDNFFWTPDQMGQFLVWNEFDHGMFPYEKALRWIDNNPQQVLGWLGDIGDTKGD